MFADPKNVTPRRWKRHIKAGVSIVVAVAAGTFLACQRALERRAQPSTTATQDTGVGNTDSGSTPVITVRDAQTATVTDVVQQPIDAARATDATSTSVSTTDASVHDATAITPRPPRPIRPHVDHNEHRNGMPVRDNLME